MSLFEDIREMLSEQLNMPLESITPESALAQSLGMDYVDIIQLALRLEVKYNIDLPDEEMERIVTVNDLVEHVKNKRGSGKESSP